jgi:VWFA-related protein
MGTTTRTVGFPIAGLLVLLLASGSTSAQNTNKSTGGTQTTPVIRVTTRLIQLSVVVHDRHGKSITGLKKEDFIVLDNHEPQQIAFFSATGPTQNPRPSLLPIPPNFYTNRPELKGVDPPETIVVLFDCLNTSFEDQAFGRKQVLKFLKTIKPQDRVAIFALTTELVPVHDFTEDAAALAGSVERFSPKLLAAFDASNPEPFQASGLGNDPFFQSFAQHVNNANAQIADWNLGLRVGTTYRALLALTDYVELIPGRKSLVWITAGVPMDLGRTLGVPDRDTFSWAGAGTPTLRAANDMNGLTRALNRVNLAVYPIDVHGLDVTATPDAFFARQSVRDTFRSLADGTGGKAYYGTNDIAGAMDAAFEDGRFTYTLGFYPDHGEWNGKFRKLRVRVDVIGARLRYRRGYYAANVRPPEETSMKRDLHDTANSPLDATELGISVRTRALEPASGRMVQLQVMLDAKQFLLRQENERSRGGMDLLFLQSDAGGKFLAADKQHVELNIPTKEDVQKEKLEITLQKRVKIERGAVAMRVLVRDVGTGEMGSVTFPVSDGR